MSDTPQGEIPTVQPSTADLSASNGHAHLPIGERPGDSIGPYRLLSVLGEGGFGVVFLAERREPFVQRVALKVIKPGMDTKAVVARFEQERQALAVMDHPNVAKVVDGGVTPSGRPYFVMEHVAGEPITEYCDRHNLSIRDRLELFIPVCEAVQHAHHKGLIHRDLKPSNILVSVRDNQPIPKVIDFGVAKAISHTLTDKTIFTEQGMLIGTPEYMSPEQAEMGATDIDTRSDVYALGVVLYELLSGALPFDPKELRRAAFARIQQIIRDTETPRPSTRLTSLGAEGAAVARRRQVRLEELTRELRRELEWVPLKAMRKDRTRRYQTAAALADDVSNYIAQRPLLAGPESASYRARKILVKHRAAVAVAAGIAAALLGATGITAASAIEARRERDAARRAEHAADTGARVLERLLRLEDRPLTTPEALRLELADIDAAVGASVSRDPGAESAARVKLARWFLDINDYAAAGIQAERVAQVAPSGGSPVDDGVLALVVLGIAARDRGDFERAAEYFEAAFGRADTLTTRNNLAVSLAERGLVDQAIAMLDEVQSGTAFERNYLALNRSHARAASGDYYGAEYELRHQGGHAGLSCMFTGSTALPPCSTMAVIRWADPTLHYCPDSDLRQLGVFADQAMRLPAGELQALAAMMLELTMGPPSTERSWGSEGFVPRSEQIRDRLAAARRAFRDASPAAAPFEAIQFRAFLDSRPEWAAVRADLEDLKRLWAGLVTLPVPREQRLLSFHMLSREFVPSVMRPSDLFAIAFAPGPSPLEAWTHWAEVVHPDQPSERYSNALAWARQAKGQFGDEGFRLSVEGAALLHLGWYEQAIDVLERASQINLKWYHTGGRMDLCHLAIALALVPATDYAPRERSREVLQRAMALGAPASGLPHGTNGLISVAESEAMTEQRLFDAAWDPGRRTPLRGARSPSSSGK